MKHFVDIIVSFLALLILMPMLIIIALVIRVRLGSPVFFRQERAGLQGVPFFIIKFRTMSALRDEQGVLLPDVERMTPLGSFLRKTSLDELPELLNVLRGDMSLVGPRPLPVRYIPRYSPEQFKRHEIRPGITGWAQINGRNSQTWEQRFELDLWYLDNRSLLLDLKILFLTLFKVLKREGISAEGEVTMKEFTGSQS